MQVNFDFLGFPIVRWSQDDNKWMTFLPITRFQLEHALCDPSLAIPDYKQPDRALPADWYEKRLPPPALRESRIGISQLNLKDFSDCFVKNLERSHEIDGVINWFGEKFDAALDLNVAELATDKDWVACCHAARKGRPIDFAASTYDTRVNWRVRKLLTKLAAIDAPKSLADQMCFCKGIHELLLLNGEMRTRRNTGSTDFTSGPPNVVAKPAEPLGGIGFRIVFRFSSERSLPNSIDLSAR